MTRQHGNVSGFPDSSGVISIRRVCMGLAPARKALQGPDPISELSKKPSGSYFRLISCRRDGSPSALGTEFTMSLKLFWI
ncbi:hypothetical protein KCV03_g20, partial [Aureobasidium melanogenum]